MLEVMMTAYEIINGVILEKLEQGVVPWKKMWVSSSGLPATSLSTGRAYCGMNQILLSCFAEEYSSPYFLTFNQARERGGRVKKGEHGIPVIFYKKVEFLSGSGNQEAEDGGDESYSTVRFFLRYYKVFNLNQCENVRLTEKEKKLLEVDVKDLEHEHSPVEKIEQFLKEYEEMPTVSSERFNEPSYSPGPDLLKMPLLEQFETREEYYSTFFHELVHSTGHSSRLDRLSSDQKKDDTVIEELIAEIGATYLSYRFDLGEQVVENGSAYIQYWISQIKENSRLFSKAASRAEKAVKFIEENRFRDMKIVSA